MRAWAVGGVIRGSGSLGFGVMPNQFVGCEQRHAYPIKQEESTTFWLAQSPGW
jgi:hypothetical protein